MAPHDDCFDNRPDGPVIARKGLRNIKTASELSSRLVTEFIENLCTGDTGDLDVPKCVCPKCRFIKAVLQRRIDQTFRKRETDGLEQQRYDCWHVVADYRRLFLDLSNPLWATTDLRTLGSVFETG